LYVIKFCEFLNYITNEMRKKVVHVEQQTSL